MERKVRISREGTKPCFHCFKTGHPCDVKCTKDGIVSCTKCFRLNVFSSKCNCENTKKPHPAQVLRFVGSSEAPQIYLDIQLHDQVIPALLNPTLTKSKVNIPLSDWWQSVSEDSVYQEDTNTVVIRTKRKGMELTVPCEVVDSSEYIELGADFMTAVGYSITVEGTTITSGQSPVLSSPYDTEYVYNLRSRGSELRSYLNRKKFFMKKGRIIKPSLRTTSSTSRKVIIRRWSQSTKHSSTK